MNTNHAFQRTDHRTMRSCRTRAMRRAAGSTLALASAIALLIGTAACAGKKQPLARAFEPIDSPRAMRTPPRWDPGDRLITQPIAGVRQRDNADPPQLVSSVRFAAPAKRGDDPDRPAIATVPPGELIAVRYAASAAPVVDVLRVMIQDFLDEDFVIDPAFGGNQTVTLSIDRSMTRSEVRDTVASLALMVGGRLERRQGMLVLRSDASGAAGRPATGASAGTAAGAIARNPDTPLLQSQSAFGGAMPVIRVHSFRHIQGDALNNMLQAFLTPGATIVTAGTTVVIADTAANVDRVMGLIDRLDVPAFTGVEVWTYRLRNRTPESAKITLDALAQGVGITGPNAAVSFVPVPGSDLLMAVVREPSVKEIVTDLIHQVDRTRQTMARQRYIYRVQYFPTDALTTLIADYHSDRVVIGRQQTGTTPGEQNRLPVTDMARIVSNTNQNIILIEATPDDYADILGTLRMVDRPAQQVFLRSVIAEVILQNRLAFGVEYFLNNVDIEGLGIFGASSSIIPPGVSVSRSAGTAAGAISGAGVTSGFFLGADGFVLVAALQSEGEVRILSQPTLTIANSKTAQFQVGGSVPVVTGDVDAATQVGGDTAIRRSIDFRDTGLILGITPRINESGEVTLEIEKKINEVGASSDLGPEFTTRILSTTVTVPHGQTVVLGGIIREERRSTTDKVPILGDLPALGTLFRSKDDVVQRTELFITITPMIINTPNDAALVTSPFLDATHAVRRFLLEQRDDLPEGSLVDPRFMAGAADGEPRLMQVPPRPATPEGTPSAPAAPPAAERGATPDMPPIMRALMESATPRNPAQDADAPNGSSN